MGLIKKLGRPITASRPQNKPSQIRQGAGGPAAESQIAAPPAPFQNARGAANLPARSHAGFAADQPQGDPAPGTRPRSWRATQPTSQPPTNEQVMRGVGYKKPINYAGYKVHIRPKGRPLIPPMTDRDFRDAEAMDKHRIL